MTRYGAPTPTNKKTKNLAKISKLITKKILLIQT